MFKKDLAELSKLLESYTENNSSKMQHHVEGGADIHLRSFTVESVEGQPYTGNPIRVELNKPTKSDGSKRDLKNPQKPKVAARRIYKSLCANLGYKKHNCDITFTMIETTRGSNHKVYGPYLGTQKAAPKSAGYEADGTKIVPKTVYNIRKVDAVKKGGSRSSKSSKKVKKGGAGEELFFYN
jgi:hypothetical protein